MYSRGVSKADVGAVSWIHYFMVFHNGEAGRSGGLAVGRRVTLSNGETFEGSAI